MPPSQLKRLKTSLREQGVTGPSKSQKQKKSGKGNKNPQDRQAALQQIRDQFNPFELRHGSSRPAKFESVSQKSGPKYKDVLHRPGVTKSAGEEMRRKQLLPELRQRNKVGGLVDRRIGEGDPGMTPEERAVQRFAREKQGKKGGAGLFDLEASDDDEPKFGLTHLGKDLTDLGDDDFEEGVSTGDESGSDDDLLRKKRLRPEEEEDADDVVETDQPERKKTKKEVMEEVIAKSKMHKYERQKAKEDDDDIREELDKGMADMLSLLRGHKPAPKEVQQEAEAALNGDGPKMDPERQKLLDGMDRAKADKEYEVRLRQLAQDSRAKPAERTKTEEEKLQDEARRLQELEQKRTRRMQGEDVSDDEPEAADNDERPKATESDGMDPFGNDEQPDEAEEFGFTSSLPKQKTKVEDKVEHIDEDEFDFDEDIVASASDMSDVELSDDSEASDDEDDPAKAEETRDAEEDDEFVKGILGNAASATGANGVSVGAAPVAPGLAYTYPCPRSHDELLDVIKAVATDQLPTVIQRIRALHHPSLSAANKESMVDFSTALVDHIAYMAMHSQSLSIIEQVIRHVHSLSRTYPLEIAEAFRGHLRAWQQREGGQPNAGDLMILTAIGSIYPTSDHFHQVVTPAITLMAKWLGLTSPDTPQKRTTGAFIIALALQYQTLSKRYIPEALRFTLKILSTKPSPPASELTPHLSNLTTMAHLWTTKSAFPELFAPFLPHLKTSSPQTHQTLQILLHASHHARRPLTLHTHRPQPIRSSIPKFEESYNPDKHYDPDRERSDAKKLQKEYKREKKGAVRELRKDANFIGRELLREKRTKDEEYERKQRRLIAEIQGEEGHEAKSYERERAGRKRGR